jgi:hypothetical protein
MWGPNYVQIGGPSGAYRVENLVNVSSCTWFIGDQAGGAKDYYTGFTYYVSGVYETSIFVQVDCVSPEGQRATKHIDVTVGY